MFAAPALPPPESTVNLPFFPPLLLHLGISIPACCWAAVLGMPVWMAVVGVGGLGAIGLGSMGLFRLGAPEVDDVPWLVMVVDEPDEVLLAVRRPDELEPVPPTPAARPPRRGPEAEAEPDEWFPPPPVLEVVDAGEMALRGECAAGVAAAEVETGGEGVEVNALILTR